MDTAAFFVLGNKCIGTMIENSYEKYVRFSHKEFYLLIEYSKKRFHGKVEIYIVEGTMSNTRIVVLQAKKMIYGGIFALIAIIILVALLVIFWPGRGGEKELSLDYGAEEIYEPGVYTKELKLGDTSVNLQLTLDEDHVKSLELVNLEDSVETMYPLMKPTVEKISEQLTAGKEMEEIVLSEDAQYTEKILVESVMEMLSEHEK